MKTEYLERIYSGWLAKIIGIRLGAAIEGWTYEKIRQVYGELDHYPVDYRDFAADDDSNGPLFFLRALEDGKSGLDLSSEAVGEALLNYAPFEHSFFWWGGYGTSTEHTAYLNLRSGIPAPRSGSIEQNGAEVAEQIGGQIFIDSWGLVNPGNPDRAARFAAKAAGVSHDRNGIYGGVFIASCIAYAFEEKNILRIIEKGLSYIPPESEYTRMVRAVMAYHEGHPENWRDGYRYVFENFGYDRYPGNCHIIPNAALIILALLYGRGDFSDTINICNMCGWDTDCNVGNVAAIMGVVTGLEGIDYQKWRRPINDFLACSSVMGSMNIMDIPGGAAYIARLAWALEGEELPPLWKEICSGKKLDSCHFEFPGSTHAIRVRTGGTQKIQAELTNTEEAAYSGKRSLKVHVMPAGPREQVYVYKKTYYYSRDFHDSRYDPSFSPLLYPGQSVHGSAYLPEYANGGQGSMYVHNADTGEIIEGKKVELKKGQWVELECKIPPLEAGLIDEAGFVFDTGEGNAAGSFCRLVDDLYFDGKPDYTIDFTRLKEDFWNRSHRDLLQFSRLKGLWYLDGGEAHLSCADFGEAYTGGHDWKDYTAEFDLRPITGEIHLVNVRVQGAIRSYAAGFGAAGKIGLYKNENGYRPLAEKDFSWEKGRNYTLTVAVKGGGLSLLIDGKEELAFTDTNRPYLRGSIGLSVRNGSHCACRGIRIN